MMQQEVLMNHKDAADGASPARDSQETKVDVEGFGVANLEKRFEL